MHGKTSLPSSIAEPYALHSSMGIRISKRNARPKNCIICLSVSTFGRDFILLTSFCS